MRQLDAFIWEQNLGEFMVNFKQRRSTTHVSLFLNELVPRNLEEDRIKMLHAKAFFAVLYNEKKHSLSRQQTVTLRTRANQIHERKGYEEERSKIQPLRF